MADEYRIDAHKLMYHPRRVAAWLEGRNIFPIYMEISPSGACNHRCIFCSLDYMGYQNRRLETARLLEIIRELAAGGLKSLMYGGEGEPFLHPDMADIAAAAREAGIDNAFTSNGVLMTPEKIDRILPVSEWIKISCNAGTRECYAKMHRAKEADFDRVLDNLRYAVAYRKEKKLSCTLGIQTVLLEENLDTVEHLAERVREIGLDYYVIKPYMPHHLNRHDFKINYENCAALKERLKSYENEKFSIISRMNAMKRHDSARKEYACCYSLPFWSYLDAGGNIWGCSVHLTEKEYLFGNIYEQTFTEIWNGEKRKRFMEKFLGSPLPENCKINCRMDEVNKYLWDLKNPVKHVNFI